jgi:hypothetical protein
MVMKTSDQRRSSRTTLLQRLILFLLYNRCTMLRLVRNIYQQSK